MVVRDVPLHGGRTLAAPTPRFNLVGIHWQGAGIPWFRTRSIGGRWSAWQAADDDWGRDGVWRKGNAVWTGAAEAIQIRKVGSVERVREFLLWSPPVPATAERRLQIAGAPKIITRAGWQADESIRRAASALRAGAEAHGRPPHGHEQRLLVRALGLDRARHRGLPREGKRLGRHRLQLSRRRVRPGFRGPVRRRHEERRGRALRWVQQRHDGRLVHRHVHALRSRRRRRRTRSSNCSPGVSTSRTSTRSRTSTIPRVATGSSPPGGSCTCASSPATATPTSPSARATRSTGCCRRSRSASRRPAARRSTRRSSPARSAALFASRRN